MKHGHCIVGLSIYGKPKDLCLLRSQNQRKGGRNGNAAKSCGLPMFSEKGSIADPNTTNHVLLLRSCLSWGVFFAGLHLRIKYKLILNFGKLWRNLVNFGELWRNLVKFGEIWWNLEKFSEICKFFENFVVLWNCSSFF